MPKVLIYLLILLLVLEIIRPVAAIANAIIQNDSSYVDILGFFHVVGEIRNTGDVWLHSLKVTGTLKDSSGQIVDTDTTYAYADALPPGGKAPFNLIELDAGKSALISSYTLVLEFLHGISIPQQSLQIQGASYSVDSLGYFEVDGTVVNNGAQISKFTKVIGTFYGVDGKVLYVGFTFTSPDTIPPGQVNSFRLTVPDAGVSARIANYELFVQSDQYTSVPEFPSYPSLVATLVILLSVLMLREERRNRLDPNSGSNPCR